MISFWLPWYQFAPDSELTLTLSGPNAHGWLFLAVVDCVVLVLYTFITAFGLGELAAPGRLSKDQLLSLMTGANLVLVVLAFLLKPSGFHWAWGSFVAVVAAIVAFVPFGLPLLQARRRR